MLAKTLLRNVPADLKLQQFVRIRVIWREAPGITIPVTAVSRISGQYFCFVAVPEGSGLVARSSSAPRPSSTRARLSALATCSTIQVGQVRGNDYVVSSGLKAGDQAIVGGIQKIADGAPVKAQ